MPQYAELFPRGVRQGRRTDEPSMPNSVERPLCLACIIILIRGLPKDAEKNLEVNMVSRGRCDACGHMGLVFRTAPPV